MFSNDVDVNTARLLYKAAEASKGKSFSENSTTSVSVSLLRDLVEVGEVLGRETEEAALLGGREVGL